MVGKNTKGQRERDSKTAYLNNTRDPDYHCTCEMSIHHLPMTHLSI